MVWTGLLVLPASILTMLLPDTALPVALAVAGVVAVAAFDAVSSRPLINDVELTMPVVSRLSVGRNASIPVRVRTSGLKRTILRIGLPFETDSMTADTDRRIGLSLQAETVVDWSLRAHRPGRYFLRQYYLEVPSRLKLWGVRQRGDLESEIRVYPDLRRERRHLAAFFLNRGFGLHTQRQVGQGKEFEQLREFMPGDCLEDIHWKATARRGEPITKVYQIERTQQVYVIIDGSRLSARWLPEPDRPSSPERPGPGSSAENIMDVYNAAGLVTGMAAQRQGDLFGLIVFDNKIRRFLPAKAGKGHYDLCRDTLYTMKPGLVSPDFRELATFIATRVRRRSLLMVLTSLDDPVLAEEFCRNAPIIARRHLVMVAMLKPPGVEPLFSSRAVAVPEDLYHRLGGHMAWRRLQETERMLHRKGIQLSMAPQTSLGSELVGRYLAIKQRQVL
jgi:uncharacterized protein (DUF58 family)